MAISVGLKIPPMGACVRKRPLGDLSPPRQGRLPRLVRIASGVADAWHTDRNCPRETPPGLDRLAFGSLLARRVGGHEILPIDGQLISPLAVTKAPH